MWCSWFDHPCNDKKWPIYMLSTGVCYIYMYIIFVVLISPNTYKNDFFAPIWKLVYFFEFTLNIFSIVLILCIELSCHLFQQCWYIRKGTQFPEQSTWKGKHSIAVDDLTFPNQFYFNLNTWRDAMQACYKPYYWDMYFNGLGKKRMYLIFS